MLLYIVSIWLLLASSCSPMTLYGSLFLCIIPWDRRLYTFWPIFIMTDQDATDFIGWQGTWLWRLTVTVIEQRTRSFAVLVVVSKQQCVCGNSFAHDRVLTRHMNTCQNVVRSRRKAENKVRLFRTRSDSAFQNPAHTTFTLTKWHHVILQRLLPQQQRRLVEKPITIPLSQVRVTSYVKPTTCVPVCSLRTSWAS